MHRPKQNVVKTIGPKVNPEIIQARQWMHAMDPWLALAVWQWPLHWRIPPKFSSFKRNTHRRRDATKQFRLVGVGGVYWALRAFTISKKFSGIITSSRSPLERLRSQREWRDERGRRNGNIEGKGDGREEGEIWEGVFGVGIGLYRVAR